MKNKRVFRIIFAFLLIALFPLLTGVAVKADDWVEVGTSITLTDDNMTNGTGYDKTWASGDTSIVSTQKIGNGRTCTVTGLKPGKVTIACHTHSWVTRREWVKTGPYASDGEWRNVTHDDYTTSYHYVEVRQGLKGLTLSKTSLTLSVGATDTITVTPVPANATVTSKKYSSSKPSVASVLASGKVTAVSEGTAVITVKLNDSHTAICTVTVTAEGTGTGGAGSGGAGTGGATGNGGTGTGSGKNSGKTDGTAQDSGWDGGSAQDSDWDGGSAQDSDWDGGSAQDSDWDGGTASGNSTRKLTLNKKNLTMEAGEKYQLTAKLKGKKITPKYKTSDSKIVSVDKNGKLSAKTCGTAKIKVTSGGKSAVCSVKVVPGKIKSWKASVKKSTVTFHWARGKKLSGYKIYRAASASGKFKEVKNVKASGKTAVLRNQKKGVYYYKIRGYKKVKGKAYVSPASKAVRVEIK